MLKKTSTPMYPYILMRLFCEEKLIFNLNCDNHEYSTPSKDKPRIPLYKTNYLKYSPHYSRVQIYQNIPNDILNLPRDDF